MKLGPYELNKIYTGDAMVLSDEIPNDSIDLIFTDPPYHKKYLYLYKWLAEVSPRILKPTGFLLVYVGGYWKDEIMAMTRQHLEYFWDFSLYMSKESSILWPRKVIARAKAILAYRCKGTKALPRTNVLGAWFNSSPDKRFHEWGQDEETARYYIDCFSSVGSVIFDPFCGGGTTPFVCEIINRKFLAFEIDSETSNHATQRLNHFTPRFQPQLPEFEQQTFI